VIAFFRATEFSYVEESQRAGERAMELAKEFGLKGPDALHVALAETAGCDEFYSLDGKHLRIGDQLPTMRVLRPYGDPQSEFEL
jgi:predicted nucleic acid-binding protein